VLAGRRRFARGGDDLEHVQGVFGRHEQLLAGREAFGRERRALLPDVSLRIRRVAPERRLLLRRQVDPLRRPV